MRDLRMSGPTLKVLRHLLGAMSPDTSGAGITKATGIGPGTLYPLLARLERAGWAVGEWEAVDPREAGRPRRRFYTLTPLGHEGARRELEALQLPPGGFTNLARSAVAALNYVLISLRLDRKVGSTSP